MTPFNSVKQGIFDRQVQISLNVDYQNIKIEIVKDGKLITCVNYPNTQSGLSYAKRVYNSLM